MGQADKQVMTLKQIRKLRRSAKFFRWLLRKRLPKGGEIVNVQTIYGGERRCMYWQGRYWAQWVYRTGRNEVVREHVLAGYKHNQLHIQGIGYSFSRYEICELRNMEIKNDQKEKD